MSETIQLEVSNVLTAYQEASRKGKQLLENLVPKLFAKDMKERLKTFSDACQVLGIPVNDNLSAYEKLKIIIKCFNQNWKADYSNSNQRKYYPWFRYTAGSGFSLYDVRYDYSHTSVGAPFVFEHEADAKYCAVQFQSLYNEMLNY